MDRWLAVLSIDEIARVNRFHLTVHRQRFLVGRGLLRTVLGNYLSIAPRDIPLQYTPNGKPIVPNTGLHFNVSHSNNRFVCGITYTGAIGVDVEVIRPIQHLATLIDQVCSVEEHARLRAEHALQMTDLTSAFFRCWTQKEAYAKALGTGIDGLLGENVDANSLDSEVWHEQALAVWSDAVVHIVVACPQVDVHVRAIPSADMAHPGTSSLG